jgi:hypothetical protein
VNPLTFLPNMNFGIFLFLSLESWIWWIWGLSVHGSNSPSRNKVMVMWDPHVWRLRGSYGAQYSGSNPWFTEYRADIGFLLDNGVKKDSVWNLMIIMVLLHTFYFNFTIQQILVENKYGQQQHIANDKRRFELFINQTTFFFTKLTFKKSRLLITLKADYIWIGWIAFYWKEILLITLNMPAFLYPLQPWKITRMPILIILTRYSLSNHFFLS